MTRRDNGAALTSGTYALVGYVPNPLGDFLNRLRAELVSGCSLRSHVTVLPPRNLETRRPALTLSLGRKLQKTKPVDVLLTDVEIFPITNVIFLALGAGRAEVEAMHRYLGSGLMASTETFPFHPHVTLAQDIPLLDMPEASQLARRRWAEWRSKRSFRLDRLTFVEHVKEMEWAAVREFALSADRLRQTA